LAVTPNRQGKILERVGDAKRFQTLNLKKGGGKRR